MPIYISAYEYVTQRTFNVYAPAFYQPHLPKEMLNPIVKRREAPNRWKPYDEKQMQRCSYTIEIMLDMFQKGIEFEIADENDIPEIFDNIDRFLMTLETDITLGEDWSTNYARLLVKWRAEVYKHYYRYMQMHPGVKDTLYPNNDQKKNLLSLLSMVSGTSSEQRNLDPLRARQFPPFDIDAIKPKPAEEKEPTLLDSGLSLGADRYLSDNGRDFDFDDFLSRKG